MSLRIVPARPSRGRSRALLRIACLAAVWASAAAAWAIIPSDALLQSLKPRGYVNDFAGILKPGERQALENRAHELQQKTGAQLAIVILKSLEGGQVDDFTNKLFSRWGVGKKGKNNGVMLLVALDDHKARIEVGYGLEPILPDALAGRVRSEQLFPAFKRLEYAAGLSAAVARIAEIIERNEPASPRVQHNDEPSAGVTALIVFLFLFVLVGFGIAGTAAADGHVVQTLWGLFAGGVPLLVSLVAARPGFLALLLVGGIAFIAGWIGTRPSNSSGSRGRSWPSGGSWGDSGFGGGGFSSGGFGGGGFGGGGGGGFGGFGGGSSGGGGASGSW